MTLSLRARRAIRHSRLFLCLVTPQWLDDPHSQALYAYAQQCGLPFRVIVFEGVRLPETAFAGITDLRLIQSQGVEADKAQVRAWIEEVSQGEKVRHGETPRAPSPETNTR